MSSFQKLERCKVMHLIATVGVFFPYGIVLKGPKKVR